MLPEESGQLDHLSIPVLDTGFLITIAGINCTFTNYKLVLTTSICMVLGKPQNYPMSQLDCFPLCLDEEMEAWRC